MLTASGWLLAAGCLMLGVPPFSHTPTLPHSHTPFLPLDPASVLWTRHLGRRCGLELDRGQIPEA